MDFNEANLVRRDSIQALFDGYETIHRQSPFQYESKTVSTKGM